MAEKDAQDVTEEVSSKLIDLAIGVIGGVTAAGEAGAATESTTVLEETSHSLTKHGELTNGTYTVSKEAMKKHIYKGVSGKSIFYSTVDAEEIVLRAAEFADKNGLWVGNKAKVPVLNSNIGTLSNEHKQIILIFTKTRIILFMVYREL